MAEGDIARIQSAISQIAEQDRGLGEVLDALAYNFDYDNLLKLIAQAEEQRSAILKTCCDSKGEVPIHTLTAYIPMDRRQAMAQSTHVAR